jgi:acetyltransferase-like isoleucine patch superfamily enzyme
MIKTLYHFLIFIYSKFANLYSNLISYIYNIERKSWIYGNGYIHFYTQGNGVIFIGQKFSYNSHTFYNRFGVRNCCFISVIQNNAKIIIGNNVGVSGVFISAWQEIKIGNNVLIGANTIITDSDWHPINSDERDNHSKVKFKPVIIDDDVWIGANVLILKGVKIGRGSIISAGSVVFDDVPEYSLVKGNPASVVKKLNYK